MINEIELYDLYDIWYVPAWYVLYRYHLIAMIMVFIILVFCFYCYKKRFKRTINPWDKALLTIKNLEISHYKKPEEIYCAVTTIFKEYVNKRYSINVYGKTDKEMLEIISLNNCMARDTFDELAGIYKDLPVLKFAQESKKSDLIKQDLDKMVGIIKKTIPNKETPS